jgi:hypothetical protein
VDTVVPENRLVARAIVRPENAGKLCVVIRISAHPNPCYPYTFLYADEHDTIARDSG